MISRDRLENHLCILLFFLKEFQSIIMHNISRYAQAIQNLACCAHLAVAGTDLL